MCICALCSHQLLFKSDFEKGKDDVIVRDVAPPPPEEEEESTEDDGCGDGGCAMETVAVLEEEGIVAHGLDDRKVGRS